MKYTIYQIDSKFETCPYVFRDYSFAKDHGFTLKDYDMIYSDNLSGLYETDEGALNNIYYIFNCEHPVDFCGHSLSVSDLVELNGRLYYVDSFGFKEVC